MSGAPRSAPPARSRLAGSPGRPSPARASGSLPTAPARVSAPGTHHRLPAPRGSWPPPSSNPAARARGASPGAARAQQRAAAAPCARTRGSGCGSRSGRGGYGHRGSPASGPVSPCGVLHRHASWPGSRTHGTALAARSHQVILQEAPAIGPRSALHLHVNGTARARPETGRPGAHGGGTPPRSSWC